MRARGTLHRCRSPACVQLSPGALSLTGPERITTWPGVSAASSLSRIQGALVGRKAKICGGSHACGRDLSDKPNEWAGICLQGLTLWHSYLQPEAPPLVGVQRQPGRLQPRHGGVHHLKIDRCKALERRYHESLRGGIAAGREAGR